MHLVRHLVMETNNDRLKDTRNKAATNYYSSEIQHVPKHSFVLEAKAQQESPTSLDWHTLEDIWETLVLGVIFTVIDYSFL